MMVLSDCPEVVLVFVKKRPFELEKIHKSIIFIIDFYILLIIIIFGIYRTYKTRHTQKTNIIKNPVI